MMIATQEYTMTFASPCLSERAAEMNALSKADIIRNLFAAYLAGDRDAVEGIFADDFRFTSPFDVGLDKAAYFERCWRGSDWIAQHRLERIVIDGETAFVTYRCVATDGKSFRNTEFMTFEGEQVVSIDVYFGATYRDGVFTPMPAG
jgi:ketosteroid isomerase-like protein